MQYKKYLNMGCGSRFHPDWTNIDIVSYGPAVIAYDLRHGIPYSNCTFNIVYHSHLLEHLKKHEALDFLKECFRVLKPNGIIRVVVPNLEEITGIYLKALERACHGDPEWQHNYEWIMLELYDQTVRENSGGVMLEYLIQEKIPNEAFINKRMGNGTRQILEMLQKEYDPKASGMSRKFNCLKYLRKFSQHLRMKLIRRLLGDKEYRALQIGLFRMNGEIHHWMYDKYSLAQLLKRAGFSNPIQCNAFKSQIENWEQFALDTESDGTVYKPDSLYMEAIKH
ncbi:MAG: class I SAM-dependent methyltransferase [bacterium]